MATIETTFTLGDRMSSPLANIDRNLSQVLGHIQTMDERLSGISQNGLTRTETNLKRVERASVETSGSLETLATKVKGVFAAYMGWQAVKEAVSSFVKLSDELAGTSARMAQITGQAGDVEKLNEKVFASAQRSRASFLSTAGFINRVGQMSGDLFGSEDELIAFSETVNKTFAIGGTDAQEMAAATLQLSQALGSGVLRGDELNSVFESAPLLIQSIADYLNVPVGQIRNMAAEGQITSEIVKNAILASSDEINAKFEDMPKTWSQVWQGFVNDVEWALRPLSDRFSQMINSEGFANTLQTVESIITGLINSVNVLVTVITATGNAFGIWDDFGQIVKRLTQIIGVTLAAAIVYAGVTHAKWALLGLKWNLTVIASWMVMHQWMIIIIGVLALVAAAVQATGITWQEALTDVLGVAYGVGNALKTIFHNAWEGVKATWGNGINTIRNAFDSLLNSAAHGLATLLSKVPGQTAKSWASSLNGVNLKTNYEVGYTADFRSVTDAYASGRVAGRQAGQGLVDRISSAFNTVSSYQDQTSDFAGSSSIPDEPFQPDDPSDLQDTADDIKDNTDKIKNLVGVSAEEMSLLRSAAEQRAMNHVEQTINLSVNAALNGTAPRDIDGFVSNVAEVFIADIKNNKRALVPGGVG